MNKTKWEQGVYKPEDFMPKKRVRLSTARKTNRGKKYWTKRFDMRFKQTLLGISLFCVVVAGVGAMSTYHTKKYNSIMNDFNTFKEARLSKKLTLDLGLINPQRLLKAEVVKAEGLPVFNQDEKPVQKVNKVNQFENIKRVAKIECDKKGFGDFCVKDLLGIAHNEKADFDCDNAIGDGGVSHGCFQIHRKSHPDVTVEQARDVNFAVPWTLNRMVHYGYPTKRSYAIMRHNGRAYIPETLEYLRKVNEYIKTL